MPIFRTKKEAFNWLRLGQKTIDVRKGIPRNGEIAVYLSGRKVLRFKIVKKEIGTLAEVLRTDNFKLVIPSACTIEEAMTYLRQIYNDCEGVFTAYYVALLES